MVASDVWFAIILWTMTALHYYNQNGKQHTAIRILIGQRDEMWLNDLLTVLLNDFI